MRKSYPRPLGLNLRAYPLRRRPELEGCLGPGGYAQRLPLAAQAWLVEYLLTFVAANAARVRRLPRKLRLEVQGEDNRARRDVLSRGLGVPLEEE